MSVFAIIFAAIAAFVRKSSHFSHRPAGAAAAPRRHVFLYPGPNGANSIVGAGDCPARPDLD